MSERSERKCQAESIFGDLGLEITSTRAGRYFKSSTGLEDDEGFRWWLTTLSKISCNRFGLQVLLKTAAPEIVRAISKIDGFVTKDSGDCREIYRELSYMPDCTPDIASIKSAKKELRNFLNVVKKIRFEIS